jgi:hypothetical protein
MAEGTMALFEEFAKSIGDGRIDLESDDFKVAFVTLQVGGTPTIAADDAVPTWGAGGTTDLSADEATPGGAYAAGGELLANVVFTQAAGVAKFDADDKAWVSLGAGDPTDIKTAVIYSNDAPNKDCIAFIDMTTDGETAISMLAGDITVAFGAAGILTVTVNNP